MWEEDCCGGEGTLEEGEVGGVEGGVGFCAFEGEVGGGEGLLEGGDCWGGGHGGWGGWYWFWEGVGSEDEDEVSEW